ncbi:glycosyltransferase family 4 protein [Thomasclavelia sp.]|uniref:glycosyltransferase family 4 protein n=1 Tax=Thomasclavelia sp. TaxID=3025757 RepID=UPI002624C56F|nr:glycosyltransferase family 4 protein [Thomasclavelia sp.]
MKSKLKILYITNVPSPYRLDYFKELGKYCNLTVLFEKSTSDERDSSWTNYNFQNFTGIIMNGYKVSTDSAFCPNVLKYIGKEKFDHIVITDFLLPTGMLAILYMRFFGIKYWLESDGGFSKNGEGIKEKIKKFFIKNAYGYFSTCDNHDNYYLSYGATPERIFRYIFTSLRDKDIEETPLVHESKIKLRKDLNIDSKKVVLGVGRFIHLKGYDNILEVAKIMMKQDIKFVIIGGNPTEEYLKYIKENNLKNVIFINHLQKDELKRYYRLADVFVHPTRSDVWGLVINEAMANGLPIITTNKCNAGLELISNGKNGYIIDVDNVEELQDAIINTLKNSCQMGNESLRTIKNYTIENMAKEHMVYFEKEKSTIK